MATTITNGQATTTLPLPSRGQQQVWAQLPVAARLQAVRRFRHLLVDHAEQLCDAVQQDLGKPHAETLACEILPVAEACKFLERHAARLLRPRRVSVFDRPLWLWGQRDAVHRRPRGIIGIIGTWNYPLFLNGVQIVQALTAGNAVLWKPSEVAPRSADALWETLCQARFPEGLHERLPATREAGRQLADADVDHVVFTGHADTGRVLASHLGKRLISSTLELSGCDAMFVLDNADVELAARAAWFGTTLNGGQTCLAVRRAFVARPVYDDFLQALARHANGSPPAHLALPAQSQQAVRLIQEALADGARLLCGDQRVAESDRITPAIVVDARPEMNICREASFAPLSAVIPFDRLEEALAAQGLCPYALGASVFTQRPERAIALAPRLRAGSVCVNDVIAPTAHPATPFGGWHASGWGVTHGAEGLLEMTVPQVVSIRSGRWRPHYDRSGATRWTSYSMLKAMLHWDHGGTWGTRWRGLRGLFKGLTG
jgi:acyl-CoA reductase-like NAD-dependent aldehyde dehydrogenase